MDTHNTPNQTFQFCDIESNLFMSSVSKYVGALSKLPKTSTKFVFYSSAKI